MDEEVRVRPGSDVPRRGRQPPHRRPGADVSDADGQHSALLKREQEIALAKKIEVTRKRFRRMVLECDGALNQVVDTLRRVHSGDLPFDRTVKVSLTENLEKDKIMARMPHEPASTLEHLMEQNQQDFDKLVDVRLTDEEEKHKLRRLLRVRRRKAVTLVEELSIRTQKIQPLMKKLEQISAPHGPSWSSQIESLTGTTAMPAGGPGERSKKSCTTT